MSHGRDIAASDWTDEDLLTRDEASGRLKEEIDAVRERLAMLESGGSDAPADAASVLLLTRRLSALEKLYGAL
ncbi:hypothetical protein [Streptomyces sp. GQFP]|uniref:hypothetical protein n=1 Tax=Streptomyces sp. GQFP TaxID=2907545 RepID=UPI001F469B64|nr:hypothetical protein [Streptomyces sp. GQFP]UIX29283.1 hypothetical protein LUX31_04150 [Streptomyces sp. GQFP]